MIFNKKSLSKELKLKEILFDINNIAHANPNAALSQLRTFIEIYVDGVLMYENSKIDMNSELVKKINEIKKYDLLTMDEIELIHQIRKTGNDAVHRYYSSIEEVLSYLQVCNNIYNKFINKYEGDRINYNKKLMKNYKENLENKKKITIKNKYIKFNKESGYKGKLITEDKVIIANERFKISNLKQYEYLKKRLLEGIEKTKSISIDLGIEELKLESYKNNILNNRFNLIILGEFNRGKSTFLNALLGERILPSNILPTTSVITRINYSENPKVKVTFDTGEEKNINYDELINYVTTLNGTSTNNIIITDVYYPTSICKNGCVIIDTPGVNDLNEQNIVITESYIPQGDAVIFMLDPDQVFTKSEREFIKNKILKNDIKKIFFVVNKFDTVNKSGLENFKKYINNTIEELGLTSKIYYLSSSKSLKCKIENTQNEYLDTFNEFTLELEEFLINEKGKYIILNGCKRLNNTLIDLIKYIYAVENDLEKDLNKLEKDYNDFLNIQNEINENKCNIMCKIDEEYILFKEEVRKVIYEELSASFDNLISKVYELEEIDEIQLKELEKNINNKINAWIKERLNPFILVKINKINNYLENILYKSINNISKFNGYSTNEQSKEIAVVEYCKFELPTCYDTAPSTVSKNNEISFMGAGAIIAMLLTGTLLSGIGGSILGLFASMLFSNEGEVTSSKNRIIKNIEDQKNISINKIIKSIEDCIDNNYKKNCEYIDKSIDSALDETSKRMKVIINEKKKQEYNAELVLENLNLNLKELFLIKKYNELIIESIEE